MANKKCAFNKAWVRDPSFRDWIQEVDSSPYEAYCRLCRKSFSLAKMGGYSGAELIQSATCIFFGSSSYVVSSCLVLLGVL